MKTLIIGLDAFDPRLFERLAGEGRLPNLENFLHAGGYTRLAPPDPPQSEVSWTSLAAGTDPGGHGLFDFVHRSPQTYALQASLLPTRRGLFGTDFVPPTTARTLFEEATRRGYPATALFWPATFPARPELPVRTLPGLGTPDIQGRLGVGCTFLPGGGPGDPDLKTPIEPLTPRGRRLFAGRLPGPQVKTLRGLRVVELDFTLELPGEGGGLLRSGGQEVRLAVGEWSPILELEFKTGAFYSLRAVTRCILTAALPEPRLYFLPLQIHPLRTPWRYGAPAGFVRAAWRAAGPYLTLGWPQDTTGLEEGWISDEHFLRLCEEIDAGRERLFRFHLEQFTEGVLACVFDTLDRVQHMFLKQRPDLVEAWYERTDALVGRLLASIPGDGPGKGASQPGADGEATVLIVSDHGFAPFHHKIHLNRWLLERGYLRARQPGAEGGLDEVDWSRTQAYALGLNSLYLNLAGREGQGSVGAEEVHTLLERLKADLAAWEGPDGRPVVRRVLAREEAFPGPGGEYGPDLVVGYSAGCRASAETGLGKWKNTSLEPNRDHWGADHCFASVEVPGVLFSNRPLSGLTGLTYRDFPALALGSAIAPGAPPPPRQGQDEEDQSLIEERLKSLGYL